MKYLKTLVQKAAEFYSKLKNKYPTDEKISEVDKLKYDLSQINSYLEYEAAIKYFDERKYKEAFEKLKKVLAKYPEASVVVGCRVNIATSYEIIRRKQLSGTMKQFRLYEKSKDDNERAAYFFAKEHKEWLESQ